MILTFSAWIFTAVFVAVSGQSLYRNQLTRSAYDYIVVGAGSAGAVVANRLSEDEDRTVLLLEAGPPPPPISEVPALLGPLQGGEFDWGYHTEPQKNACLGMVDKKCYFPRGKTLGGTSTLNAMMYVRGTPPDYENWVREGAYGWSWNDVFYYFLKSEDQRDPNLASNGYHNVGGLQSVSTNVYYTPLRDAFLDAAQSLGYNVLDYNGPDQAGFSRSQHTVRDGKRCSTEKAFLRSFTGRPNLDILTSAQATKVHFDDDKKAYAVAFTHNNNTFLIRATREIVLSAGAIGSPQLLMLSGIGPKEHLEELDIPVIVDLPGVGQNLQDHIASGGMAYVLNDTVSIASSRDFTEAAYQAFETGTGPLSVPGGIQATGFTNTKYQKSFPNWPDMQIVSFAGMFLPSNSLQPEFEEMMKNTTATKDVTHIVPIALHPKSRGTIKLKSKNPFDYPIIDPCYFCDQEDLDVLVEGSKVIRKIIASPQMQKYGPKPLPEEMEGCKGIPTESDEYLACMAKTFSLTTHHQSGTCKMGNVHEKLTVVSPELRVKGVKGLRVADASVMPTVVSGNTNAACIMIGEKVSDMIRGRTWDPLQGRLVPM